MSTMLKTVFTVVVVALAAGGGYCWYGWNFAQLDLDSARAELATSQVYLETQQRELAVTRGELDGTRSQLETTRSRLSSVENDLHSTEVYLTTIEAGLAATQARLTSVEADALNLHNPTLEEAWEFLKADKTDANKYVEGEYICAHFARDVNNNAERRGIRCAYIDIRYPKLAHAIVAFNTSDEGMVYFEAISDERVRPEIGKEYWRCVEPKPGRQYLKPAYDDTITEIIIIW